MEQKACGDDSQWRSIIVADYWHRRFKSAAVLAEEFARADNQTIPLVLQHYPATQKTYRDHAISIPHTNEINDVEIYVDGGCTQPVNGIVFARCTVSQF